MQVAEAHHHASPARGHAYGHDHSHEYSPQVAVGTPELSDNTDQLLTCDSPDVAPALQTGLRQAIPMHRGTHPQAAAVSEGLTSSVNSARVHGYHDPQPLTGPGTPSSRGGGDGGDELQSSLELSALELSEPVRTPTLGPAQPHGGEEDDASDAQASQPRGHRRRMKAPPSLDALDTYAQPASSTAGPAVQDPHAHAERYQQARRDSGGLSNPLASINLAGLGSAGAAAAADAPATRARSGTAASTSTPKRKMRSYIGFMSGDGEPRRRRSIVDSNGQPVSANTTPTGMRAKRHSATRPPLTPHQGPQAHTPTVSFASPTSSDSGGRPRGFSATSSGGLPTPTAGRTSYTNAAAAVAALGSKPLAALFERKRLLKRVHEISQCASTEYPAPWDGWFVAQGVPPPQLAFGVGVPGQPRPLICPFAPFLQGLMLNPHDPIYSGWFFGRRGAFPDALVDAVMPAGRIVEIADKAARAKGPVWEGWCFGRLRGEGAPPGVAHGDGAPAPVPAVRSSSSGKPPKSPPQLPMDAPPRIPTAAVAVPPAAVLRARPRAHTHTQARAQPQVPHPQEPMTPGVALTKMCSFTSMRSGLTSICPSTAPHPKMPPDRVTCAVRAEDVSKEDLEGMSDVEFVEGVGEGAPMHAFELDDYGVAAADDAWPRRGQACGLEVPLGIRELLEDVGPSSCTEDASRPIQHFPARLRPPAQAGGRRRRRATGKAKPRRASGAKPPPTAAQAAPAPAGEPTVPLARKTSSSAMLNV